MRDRVGPYCRFFAKNLRGVDRATLTTNVIYVYITAISFSMFLGLEYTVIHVRIYILSATL